MNFEAGELGAEDALSRISSIKEYIMEISSSPLDAQCEQYELVYTQLQGALARIDGV